MLAKVISGTTVGLDPIPIDVEVSIEGSGFPAFNIAGKSTYYFLELI